MWDDSFPKIKHETVRMNFKAGDLKHVDVRLRLTVFLG